MAKQNKQPQETRKVNRNSVKIKELQKTKTVGDIGKQTTFIKKRPTFETLKLPTFLIMARELHAFKQTLALLPTEVTQLLVRQGTN